MNTQVTKLEMEVLNLIKNYTEEEFSSDEPMWAYIDDLKVNMIIFRGVLSSLIQKGIIKMESFNETNDAVSVNKNYWIQEYETANFVNLSVK